MIVRIPAAIYVKLSAYLDDEELRVAVPIAARPVLAAVVDQVDVDHPVLEPEAIRAALEEYLHRAIRQATGALIHAAASKIVGLPETVQR